MINEETEALRAVVLDLRNALSLIVHCRDWKIEMIKSHASDQLTLADHKLAHVALIPRTDK